MWKFLKGLSGRHANAEQEEVDAGDRRNNKRRPIDAAVLATIEGVSHDCRLSDVGPGGAFLTPRFDAEVGHEVMLSIPSSRVTAAARVRRVENNGVGIEFEEEAAGAIVSAWSRGLFR
jgi:PilZ domain